MPPNKTLKNDSKTIFNPAGIKLHFITFDSDLKPNKSSNSIAATKKKNNTSYKIAKRTTCALRCATCFSLTHISTVSDVAEWKNPLKFVRVLAFMTFREEHPFLPQRKVTLAIFSMMMAMTFWLVYRGKCAVPFSKLGEVNRKDLSWYSKEI